MMEYVTLFVSVSILEAHYIHPNTITMLILFSRWCLTLKLPVCFVSEVDLLCSPQMCAPLPSWSWCSLGSLATAVTGQYRGCTRRSSGPELKPHWGEAVCLWSLQLSGWRLSKDSWRNLAIVFLSDQLNHFYYSVGYCWR